GGRGPQLDRLGKSWDGAVGVSTEDAPIDYKWSVTGGGKQEIGDDLKIGGLGTFFYERDGSFYADGVTRERGGRQRGEAMSPQFFQGTPEQGDFRTALFDTTQGVEEVQWGGLGTLGIESKNHSVGLTYLYTRTTDDSATLAVDTRGKEFYFPGYDP